MKKIINGALYNTETAQVLGTWTNGLYSNDFGYCAERLFQTKSGKYFLYGTGGANSKYGKWHGNSGGPGEEIRPYTMKEAMEWAEEHLDGEDYIKIFGEPDEASDDRTVLSLSVAVPVKTKLDRMKSETGKSISAIVAELVEKA